MEDNLAAAEAKLKTWRDFKKEITEKVKELKDDAPETIAALEAVLDELDHKAEQDTSYSLLKEADELFGVIFRLTYYDDLMYSVANAPLDELDGLAPVSHEKL